MKTIDEMKDLLEFHEKNKNIFMKYINSSSELKRKIAKERVIAHGMQIFVLTRRIEKAKPIS